jgi:glycosyltransferase involved in cell wall biosynthesis
MKIVFLIRSLAKGGAEQQLSLIASGLATMGHNVTVVTYYSIANTDSNLNYTRLQQSGVEIISIEKQGRYDLVGFFVRYRRILKIRQPDIIYSFLELSNILACFARLVTPKSKIVWGKRSSDIELSRYQLSLKIEHKLEKLLSFIPDCIIANSTKGHDYLILNKYKAKVKVIFNGIDTEFYKKKHDIRFSLFDKYKISPEDILIGTVGRIDYAKDYETLIHAFNLEIQKKDNLHLLIVGREVQPGYAQIIYKLVEFYKLEDRVSFIPEMEDVTDFYSSIDIFVSSSYTEGFSNVIAEAMSHNLACVVTNAGDSEILVGDAGIVVPRKNPEALAEGISQVLLIDRAKFGTLARQRLIGLYSIDSLISSTEKCLRELYVD